MVTSTLNKTAAEDVSLRQRVVAEFLITELVAVAEIHQGLVRACKNLCMGAGSVGKWVKHFLN